MFFIIYIFFVCYKYSIAALCATIQCENSMKKLLNKMEKSANYTAQTMKTMKITHI